MAGSIKLPAIFFLEIRHPRLYPRPSFLLEWRSLDCPQ